MLTFGLPVFYTMLQIFTFLAIGFMLRRYNWFSEEFFTKLGRFIVLVALPTYFFVRMSQADISALVRSLRFPLLALGICAAGSFFGWLAFRKRFFSPIDRKAGIALSGFGNASYLPLSVVELMPLSMPLIAELFDTELAIFFIGAYVFMFSPLLWSFGLLFISGGTPRTVLRGIVSPPMIGIILGLTAAIAGLGPVLSTPGNVLSAIFPALERIGEITLPVILIVLGSMAGGLRIHRENRRDLIKLSAVVSIIRFAAMPALFFVLSGWFLRPGIWTPTELWVVFLQFTTPPATNLSVMAAHHGVNQEHTTFTLLSTYLIYLFILPLYLMLFLHRFNFQV